MLTVASCAKELLEPAELSGETVTLTLNLGDGTKTAYQNGKTVWKAGDKVLISDGKNKVEVAIPSEGAGLSGCAVTLPAESLSFDGNLYAVYPVSAFASAAGDVINVTIPNDQSGLFEEANVCVAKSTDGVFMLKNATAVMKIRVEDDVETVMISGSTTDTLAGKLAVTYTDAETPVTVKASSPVKSVKIAAGGLGDTYYAAVVPGKYEEISVLALTLDGKSQRKTTTNKTLKVNDMANLGVIGDELSGSSMEGTGTEDDPLLIKDLGDITTLATFVSNGMTYEGMYLKVVNDIEDITVPIGTYDQADFYFLGNFDGNGKTLTLDMGGDDCTDNYLGLFGDVGEGAYIHDVKVAGKIKTTGGTVGGLAACVNAGSGARIENCTNAAVIEAGTCVGGLVGYCDSDKEYVLEFVSCANNGAVTGFQQVGGVCGYSTRAGFENCSNTAAVKATANVASGVFVGANNTIYGPSGYANHRLSTGGILGFGQNSKINNCTNSGAVTAFFKLGGIMGAGNWTPIANSTNTGVITGTGNYEYNISSQMGSGFGSMAGGIVGWVYGGGNVNNCTNDGNVIGKGGIGGIAGFVCGYNSSSSRPSLIGCTNNADIVASGVYSGGVAGLNAGTGGICGISNSFARDGTSNDSSHQYPSFISCKNTGDVTCDSKIVGGIVGLAFETRNGTWGTVCKIDKCVNEGNVTGTFWIGGILGYTFNRFAASAKVYNNVNHGTVTGTRSDADRGVVVGGIVGACGSNDTRYYNKAQFVNANNNYNDGDVLYTSKTFIAPYVGGIAGNLAGNAGLRNNYNAGYVGPADYSAPAAGAENYIGGISGNQSGNFTGYCYYAEDCVPENVGVVGAKGTAAAATNTTFDVDGVLGTTVTLYDVECSTLLQALNAWIHGSADYLLWVDGENGPVFNK